MGLIESKSKTDVRTQCQHGISRLLQFFMGRKPGWSVLFVEIQKQKEVNNIDCPLTYQSLQSDMNFYQVQMRWDRG